MVADEGPQGGVDRPTRAAHMGGPAGAKGGGPRPRDLEAESPGTHVGELAGEQCDLADRLVALDRSTDALADIEQAVTLYRTHAEGGSGAEELKAAVGEQVDWFRALGQDREADALEWQLGRRARPRRWWRR